MLLNFPIVKNAKLLTVNYITKISMIDVLNAALYIANLYDLHWDGGGALLLTLSANLVFINSVSEFEY